MVGKGDVFQQMIKSSIAVVVIFLGMKVKQVGNLREAPLKWLAIYAPGIGTSNAEQCTVAQTQLCRDGPADS